MSARRNLFTVAGGVSRDPAVDAWLDARTGDLGVLARRWFEAMRNCGDDVVELLHDGCPVACVEDAPFASVNVHNTHVNLGFFHGAALRDPQKLLEGAGKQMRHVKLRADHGVSAVALDQLIDAAYRDVKLRLR